MDRKTYTIDASNKSLGRIATKASILLQGKNIPSFEHSKDEGGFVNIINAKNLKFTGKKFSQKKYYHHSGYPGGIKEENLSDLYSKDPSKVLKKTVYLMLPKNKLRDRMIKRLEIK